MSSNPTSELGFAVIKEAFESVVREMSVNLRRAAFSSIVREARDFSVALLDVEGEVFAQAECIPIMTAGISLAFQGASPDIDMAMLRPGDAFFTNDPFKGGQHLQDIYLFTPIFIQGQLIAFGGSTAHHVDIGGSHAGLSAGASEIFQEGLRLPAAVFNTESAFFAKDGFVRRFIEDNVRVPDLVVGDLEAQFAAAETARMRMTEICARFGVDAVRSAMDNVKDYAEARMRKAIRAIPDGTYVASQSLDASPFGVGEARVATQVHVAGEHLHITFDDTSAQVPGNINCPFASTVSAVQSAVRCMIGESDIPFNEGCNRPISVEAPYRSLLNPAFPAAVRARLTPASRAFACVVSALGKALPNRAVAPGFDTTSALSVSHLEPDSGQYSVVMEILGGGWGASSSAPGADAVDNPISNCANAPVEALEADYPHFMIGEYSLNRDSGGKGRQKGGDGIRRSYIALLDGVSVAGYADRHSVGAPGAIGGEPGRVGNFRVERRNGTVENLPCIFEVSLNQGDSFVMESGGGGGFGAIGS